MLLNQMVRDGYTNLLVEPGSYDPPEKRLRRIPVDDAIAVKDALPDVDQQTLVQVVTYPLYDIMSGNMIGGITENDSIGKVNAISS